MMTNLELRSALAAIDAKRRAGRQALVARISELEADYRTQRIALLTKYNTQDRTEFNAAKAKHARDARSAQRLDKGAAEYLAFFASSFGTRRAMSGSGEMDQVRRACELSDGQYKFRALSELDWEVSI